MWHLGSVCCRICCTECEHLEEGQQVLYVGTVAQSSAGGLVRQPVEVLGCAQDGGGSGGQQAQQLPLTAPLHGLEPCQSPHCTCSTKKKVNGAEVQVLEILPEAALHLQYSEEDQESRQYNCLEHNFYVLYFVCWPPVGPQDIKT